MEGSRDHTGHTIPEESCSESGDDKALGVWPARKTGILKQNHELFILNGIMARLLD